MEGNSYILDSNGSRIEVSAGDKLEIPAAHCMPRACGAKNCLS